MTCIHGDGAELRVRHGPFSYPRVVDRASSLAVGESLRSGTGEHHKAFRVRPVARSKGSPTRTERCSVGARDRLPGCVGPRSTAQHCASVWILFAAGPVKVRAVALMLNPMTLHHRRCREVRADMSAYLDGELDAARAMRVKRHAQWCPNCRRMLKNLRRTIAGMRALRSQDPFVT